MQTIKNRLDNKNELIYIVEPSGWSIEWDGLQITRSLEKDNLMKARISDMQFGFRNKIIHFGSVNCIYRNKKIKKIHKSNKIVLTWFHVAPDDKRIRDIPKLNELVDIVHTSCQLTKKNLVDMGFSEDKVVVIPLGVDLEFFTQASNEEKKEIKERLGLPLDKIIIGSFQKDGQGWGEGDKPKMIKGPDLFCDLAKRLKDNYPIHVLLTGPARGYVKNILEEAKIPFTHKFVKMEDYLNMADYYKVLDLYPITSRVEGGPKAVLEAWASGVPAVSTRVGMVPDIMDNGADGFMIDGFDVNKLYDCAARILDNQVLVYQLTDNALHKVKEFSWGQIAQRYFNNIYKRLRNEN